MPRHSYSRRSTGTSVVHVPASSAMTAQEGTGFQVVNPTRHLSKVSGASLTPVPEYRPISRKGHEWQKDAFAYDELVPEIGSLHALTAELVSACGLVVVQEVDTTTGVEDHVSVDPRCRRVMRAFRGPVGGQRLLKRRAALHMQIAGESHLLGTQLTDDHGFDCGISWEFLSPLEVKSEERNKPGGGGKETVILRNSGGNDDGAVEVEASIARLWRQDAAHSARATSPLKRVLSLCRQLVILERVVDAISQSRLSAGILFIPEEMTFGPDDETSEEGEDSDDIDVFIRQLMEHMKAPIENRGSAAGLVPLVVKGPAELGQHIKIVSLARNLDEEFAPIRRELLERIARGLDGPPEMIEGKASLNHWSAYSVDNDFLDRHVAPLGQDIADFLTDAYLRPMLRVKEGMPVEESLTYKLAFDPRPLATRSDGGALATQGHDRIVVSDAAWLEENGFKPSDAPTADERKRRLVEKIILAAPASGLPLLPILFPELAGFIDAIAEAQVERAVRSSQRPVLPTAPDPLTPVLPEAVPQLGPGDAPAAAPGERPSDLPPGQDPATSTNDLVDQLTRAADEALTKALTRGASRVLTRVEKHPVLRDQFKAMNKVDVLPAMGAMDFRALRVTPHELIGDGLDAFAEQARTMIVAWAVGTSASTFLAAEIATTATTTMVRMLDVILQGAVSKGFQRNEQGGIVPRAIAEACIQDAMAEIAANS